ncbi:restriction endonuclease [Clostridium tertium]
MILDYSEYIFRKGSQGVVNFKHQENNVDVFYAEKGVCPFCKIKIKNDVFRKSLRHPNIFEGSFEEWETVIQCPICGWWEHVYQNSSDAMLEGVRFSEIKINTSILRKYDDNSKVVPIKALSEYIKKNPEKIYGIHHKKMEELTQSIFRECYSCDVELVGKSHDGGKDLILINDDKPTIIQVKRRTKKEKAEPVSSIRELLGTTLLHQSKSCIFVTTADHFSNMAIKEADKAKQLNLVEEFELIDYHRFIDMMQLKKKNNELIWNKLIRLK